MNFVIVLIKTEYITKNVQDIFCFETEVLFF